MQTGFRVFEEWVEGLLLADQSGMHGLCRPVSAPGPESSRNQAVERKGNQKHPGCR